MIGKKNLKLNRTESKQVSDMNVGEIKKCIVSIKNISYLVCWQCNNKKGNDMTERNSKYNASGCKDTTAYEAVGHVSKEEHKVNQVAHDLTKLAKDLIVLAGFEVIGRIRIKHKKTGKEFR